MNDPEATRAPDSGTGVDDAGAASAQVEPDAGTARLLRQLVDELRAERVPELRWEGSEERLLAALPAPVVPVVPAPSALRRASAFAAVAAGVVLGLATQGAGDHPGLGPIAASTATPVEIAGVPLAPGEAGLGGDRDLHALRVGDVVETSAESIAFARAGLVRWTLAPNSRVVIRSLGLGERGAAPSHVVTLERGSLRAEVVPREPAEGLLEPFAVEVGGTRVAVHGTAFTVTRAGEDIVVDVEHGTVAVGPTGRTGLTLGRILVGPSRASFSSDGGRSARFLARADADAGRVATGGSAAESRALVHAPATGAPRRVPPATGDARSPVDARAAGAPGAEAEVPSAEHIAPAAAGVSAAAAPADDTAPAVAAPLTTAAIRAGLARCFDQTYERGSSPMVRTSVSSTFVLQVRADGSIQSALFDPPLKPAFQTCAAGAIAGRFEAGAPAAGTTLQLLIAFEH